MIITPNVPQSEIDAAKVRQYIPECLKHHDDVVAHASQLFSAGKAETILDTDVSYGPELLLSLILFPFAIWGEIEGRKANPHKRLFKYASDGRNKLMVFREWLVRCTYQEYDHQKEAEIFYYIGMPLKHIETIDIEVSRLYIREAGSDFGGGMSFHKGDKGVIFAVFNDLKSKGRLHSEAKVNVVH